MKENDKKIIEFMNPRNACIYKERLYFFQDAIQSLCSINMKMDDLRIEKMLDADEPLGVLRIINVGDSLYLFDGCMTCIYKYNLITKQFSQLLDERDKDDSYLIVAAYPYLDKIYILSGYYSGKIYVLDTRGDNVYIDNRFANAIANYVDSDEMIITFPTFDKEVMTFCIWKTSTVITYNLISAQYEINKYPVEYKLNSIWKNDKGIIFTVVDNSSVYRIEDCNINKIYDGDEINQAYSRICELSDNALLILSRYGKNMIYIDLDGWEINGIATFQNVKQTGPSYQNFFVEYEDEIITIPFDCGEDFYRYNRVRKQLDSFRIEVDEDMDEVIRLMVRTWNTLYVQEQSVNDLEIWINYGIR